MMSTDQEQKELPNDPSACTTAAHSSAGVDGNNQGKKGISLDVQNNNFSFNATQRKAYGILSLVAACVMVVKIIRIGVLSLPLFGEMSRGQDIVTAVLVICLLVSLAAVVAGLAWMGHKLFHFQPIQEKRALAVVVLLMTAVILLELMVYGVGFYLAISGAVLILLITVDVFVDPALTAERQRRKRNRVLKKLPDFFHKGKDAKEGSGEKRTDKGLIHLNFFNIFWIFVVASMFGLAIETIFHLVVYHQWQDRTGLLWGPFSPIYGFGAILMTLALNRFHNKNFIIIFLVSAVIGGAFEYFVSWFLQYAFGVVAWNYTGMWLSIGGRTCGLFMCMWGALGVVWIKLILPFIAWLIHLIPWDWRYIVTTVCAILLVFDGVMTLLTVDCWYKREAGVPVTTPIEIYCNDHFDNTFMQDTFQTMSIHPSEAARVKS